MILLEIGNRIILETFQRFLENPEKRDEVVCADFDGVQFHISVQDPNKKNVVTLSIQWKAVPTLLKNGATEYLKAIYGSYVQPTPETGYDLSLRIDLDAVQGAEKERLAEKLSLLKRHLLAAPFRKTFAAVEKGQAGNSIIQIQYREDEAIYIKPEGGQVTVIFYITFKDPSDQVIAKVFLQEFAEGRRALKSAPAVTFTNKRETPLELKGLVPDYSSLPPGAGFDGGFVSFVLFPNHIAAKNAEASINNIITFRDYLQYHIKCSKAYLHTRMRQRVDSLLQILNRARPEPFEKKEKKTAAGRTFVRKG